MRIEEFKAFLAENHTRSFDTGRSAFRAGLSARNPGLAISLHQSFAMVGYDRVELPGWAVAFLELADRPSLQVPMHGSAIVKVLKIFERHSWDPGEALSDVRNLLEQLD
jgi:hypothetical protein